MTFWWFGAPKWQYGYQVGFFSDLGAVLTPEPDARMCLNHCKYLCFRKVPLFRLIGDSRVLKDVLGSHFGRFLGTWGGTLVVWEGPGDRLEF